MKSATTVKVSIICWKLLPLILRDTDLRELVGIKCVSKTTSKIVFLWTDILLTILGRKKKKIMGLLLGIRKFLKYLACKGYQVLQIKEL